MMSNFTTSAASEILEKKDAQTTAETNGTIKMAVGALSCKKLSGQFSTSSNKLSSNELFAKYLLNQHHLDLQNKKCIR